VFKILVEPVGVLFRVQQDRCCCAFVLLGGGQNRILSGRTDDTPLSVNDITQAVEVEEVGSEDR
jgi:hypothetical protein